MVDIVIRLRELLDGPVPMSVERKDVREAAAEIERLREALDEYKHRLHWANEELLKRGRP